MGRGRVPGGVCAHQMGTVGLGAKARNPQTPPVRVDLPMQIRARWDHRGRSHRGHHRARSPLPCPPGLPGPTPCRPCSEAPAAAAADTQPEQGRGSRLAGGSGPQSCPTVPPLPSLQSPQCAKAGRSRVSAAAGPRQGKPGCVPSALQPPRWGPSTRSPGTLCPHHARAQTAGHTGPRCAGACAALPQCPVPRGQRQGTAGSPRGPAWESAGAPPRAHRSTRPRALRARGCVCGARPARERGLF